ncbi:hypothetical protein HU200_014913 [Digitaria exilis]|uniref:Uncharacterized protein n=1 Tax=Digitaria exilis TaxID=1010633 RepID=A0A835FB75_9POAL|nr:hypothetical protein HU200_014913 [Digitaria exilis]
MSEVLYAELVWLGASTERNKNTGRLACKEALQERKGGRIILAVSGILKTVGTKLALAIKELSSIAGAAKDLQELQDRVEEIDIWLQTVGNQAKRNDQSSNWLKKLKDAAYDTEDLVHEFHMEAEKHDATVADVKNIVVKYLWTKPKSVVFQCKTAHKIKVINKRFDAIVKERSDYSTIANSMPILRSVLHISKTTGEVPLWTNVDETSIVGRDQVKNQIVSKLIDSIDQQNINIVALIGLGGSGKTSLAKLVFNDGNIIKENFEVKLWVHVSREFSVEMLVKKLFEAIADDKPDHLPLQRVSRIISEKLAGKRFLLVLDDVWTENRICWEQFMVHLKCGASGSSILLTSRSRQVAEAVDATHTCDLPFLSVVDSWKVFQQSFGISMEGLDPEFLQVGLEIVKKCGGVPLAIKVLAGVLRGMKGIEEWQSIRESNLLDVDDDEHRVSACLQIMFNNQKTLGDKTEHARISELGNLDKLNGKLQIKNINYAKYPDEAEKVYLTKKNGIKNLSLDWYSREKDVASVNVRSEELSFLDMEKDLDLLTGLEPPPGIEKLRISGYRGLQLPHWMTKQSGSRDLSGIHIQNLSNLPQFSYLSKLVLENLPNLVHLWGLTNLPRIKILKLRVMPKLMEFLTTTTGLADGEHDVETQCCFDHLSTLVIRDCPKLNVKPYFPLSLRELTLKGSNEQLLSSDSFFHQRHDRGLSSASPYIVDVKAPHITVLKLGGLIGTSSGWELLQHLCGLHQLTISRCKDLRQLPDSMRGLTYLHKLEISWCDNLVLPEWLSELQSLQTLNIIGLPLMSSLPQSIQHLTSLQYLYIYYCHALDRLPEKLGELCSLRDLQLCNLPGLTTLPESMQRLTSLRFLNLCRCVSLAHLPESHGELPKLHRFWIQACPGLTFLPCSIQSLTNLEELLIDGCPDLLRRCKEGVGEDWQLVSHIPYLTLID